MFTKILLITVTVAVVSARPQDSHGHGHGHAISSQSIVLHQSHGHVEHHVPVHHEHKPVVVLEHKKPEKKHEEHHEHHIDYYAHPKYEYEYKVDDPHTGDKKFQHESRDGDHVKGVYSLHEADGTIRIVEYSSDKHSGFNAIVKHDGHAKHVVPDHHHHH